MKKLIKKALHMLCMLCIVVISVTLFDVENVEGAIYTGQETGQNIIESVVGRYSFNYTGNTNHYARWKNDGSGTITSRIYNDTNGPYENSSTATLSQSAGAERIARAFLVWETRAPQGATDPIYFITPTGMQGHIYPTYAYNDYRYGNVKSLFCMATDVTSIVQQCGYGDYSVCNIPRWTPERVGLGNSNGGESPGAWQLIVIEEGASFPIRVASLYMGAEFRLGDNFSKTWYLENGLKSKRNGVATGQVFFGASNSGSNSPMTEQITTYMSTGVPAGTIVSNTTYSPSLYRNGNWFNNRDYNNGCIRMDLSDIPNVGNDVSSIKLDIINENWTSFFLLGTSMDIATPDFYGVQTTTVNNSTSVTVTGAFQNTATLPNTGIYNGELVVTLDSALAATSAYAVVDGATVIYPTSISGNQVIFSGASVASMMNGNSISYTVQCSTSNSGKTTFQNNAGFHGYLGSDGINTGYWIREMWTASSSANAKYDVVLQKGTGIQSVSGAGSYAVGQRVTINAVPKTGYHWVKWTGNYNTTTQKYTFTMPACNRTIKANAQANTYTICFDPSDGTEVTSIANMVVQYDGTMVMPDATGSYIKYTLDGVDITDAVLGGEIVLDDTGSVIEMSDEATDEMITAEQLELLIEDSAAETGAELEDVPEDKQENVEIVNPDIDITELVEPENETESPVADIEETESELVEENAQVEQRESNLVKNPEEMVTEEEEPHPDKKAYASIFMGWSLDNNINNFTPQWNKAETLNVAALIDAAGVTNTDGATITLYAVWDNCPWIQATHLYYTLEQAQSGFVTQEEILSHASASDREDGSPIAPGFHENGTSFSVPDYIATDFTQFTGSGSVTENLTVVDSVGSVYQKQIIVFVVDTDATSVEEDVVTRFIDEYYYQQPYENGGLSEESLWKVDSEYQNVIQETFEDMEHSTPQQVIELTCE